MAGSNTCISGTTPPSPRARNSKYLEMAHHTHIEKTMNKTIEVPDLDHDRMMFERFGRRVRPSGRLERRIVAALCAHMAERGWCPSWLDDGQTMERVSDAKSAMELIFNLDESRLTFTKNGEAHSVLLINGNGIDMLSDWGYFADDRDGFNASMETFNPEDYA